VIVIYQYFLISCGVCVYKYCLIVVTVSYTDFRYFTVINKFLSVSCTADWYLWCWLVCYMPCGDFTPFTALCKSSNV